MCLLWSTNWVFISQKTIFFIVTAGNTPQLNVIHNYQLYSLINYTVADYTTTVYVKCFDKSGCVECVLYARQGPQVTDAFYCVNKRPVIWHCRLIRSQLNHQSPVVCSTARRVSTLHDVCSICCGKEDDVDSDVIGRKLLHSVANTLPVFTCRSERQTRV
jgi:hypothetical protein